MKFDTYTQQGKKAETIELNDSIFNVEFNPDLVHQIATSMAMNKRQVQAHTKDRSEVRGGGKKPWKQKGTGRARAGSIRSPLWRHGGITFGPRTDRNFKKGIPEKMKRKALCMVLSAKAKDSELIVLDDLKLAKAKTKLMAEVLKNLKVSGKSFFYAAAQADDSIFRAVKNIPNGMMQEVRNINVLDLLSRKYLITTSQGIAEMEKKFIKK